MAETEKADTVLAETAMAWTVMAKTAMAEAAEAEAAEAEAKAGGPATAMAVAGEGAEGVTEVARTAVAPSRRRAGGW